MNEFSMSPSDEQMTAVGDDWRARPLARIVVASSCFFMLVSSASLYAAPASNALPQMGANWVQAGIAANSTLGNTMTVNQATPKIILNWNSFNIGKDAKVQFVQPGVDSIALNKIGGNSASEIFGQLGANGTIYLINNNGILFGAGSQTNVHGLLASTLNIDDNQFLSTALSQVVNDGHAALSGGTAANASVKVEAGAKINTDSGGQVLMFAPSVVNGGSIATPDGQTILAASKDKVYLAASDNDVNLRGLLVEVDTGGDVTNVGNIVAERGNITLLGLAVNQAGRLTATTSVDVNGSIRLLARDKAEVKANDTSLKADALLLDKLDNRPLANSQLAIATHTGTVTTSSGSVTEVIADTATDSSGNAKTAADAQTQNKSRINIVGKTIDVQSGSTISAKSGLINLTATETPQGSTTDLLAQNDARIYIGGGATIDASGENVALPMSRRVVAVELRGDELKDSPLQRDGVLRGETVYVDIDKGSPLIADLAPTLAKIQRDVKERSTTGGSIKLASQGDVVMADNATLNISGGSVSYESGLVKTTKLLSNGVIVDIGSADPNRHYDGILGTHIEIHPKWGKSIYGQTSLFNMGTYREGFTEGEAAGTLTVSAPALYGFDLIDLQAGATTGATQRSAPPAGGAVSIVLGKNIGNEASATIQDVLINQLAASPILNVDSALPRSGNRVQALNISAEELNKSGVGNFSLDAAGAVRVGADANIALNPGAKITLKASSIEVDGAINVPAGEIALQTQAPAWVGNGGNFAIAVTDGATLSTSGRWLNDLLDGSRSTAPLLLDGGSISIDALGDVLLANGAQLHADAGARLSDSGAFSGGNGGSIALATRGRNDADSGSKLVVGDNLSAYGFANGGTLALTANGLQIGGSQPAANNTANTLWLAPDLFARGGFSNYLLSANRSGIDVAANTSIVLQQQNYLPVALNAMRSQASAANVQRVSTIATLSPWLRKPVNLALSSSDAVSTRKENIKPHDVVIETGVQISTEPGASIAVASDHSIYIDGELNAPGGNIAVTVNPPADFSADTGFDAAQSIWLGAHARLRAAAAQTLQANPAGLALGTVYDGGAIVLTANRGSLIAEPGSLIDVSGAGYVQDVAAGGGSYRRQRINAAAGSIELAGAEGLYVYSDMYGMAAGDGYGGSLSYRLDANNRKLNDTDPSFAAHLEPRNLLVAETQPLWDSNFHFGQALAADKIGSGYVAANSIRAGGFSQLELAATNNYNQELFRNYGAISFVSDLSLALRGMLVLDSVNLALNDHAVNLSAPTVFVGGQQFPKLFTQLMAPTAGGSGTFTLNGQFIELLGNIGVSGAGDIYLDSAGDIRARSTYLDGSDRTFRQGVFTTPGNLSLTASQIYPATLTDYLFDLTGANSVFATANSGNARATVLSAGGTLRVDAPIIEHGGTLLAPLGNIELTASQSIHLGAGSCVDVSGNNQLIPFGRLLGEDIAWTYPLLAEQPIIVGQTPGKTVSMNAPSVLMDRGSQVNLSGGGDIYGIEQIPGPGGSRDFLDAAYANGAFAVIPALKTPISPYDAVEMKGSGIAYGQTIYLEGANGLPAGEYAVLPAHYALLPGAYLITPSNTVVAEGTTGMRRDGAPLVSGRFGRAFAAQYDAQWQGFYIESGSAARTRSEYTEATGNDFFADKAVDLAKDAGRISLSVTDQLLLNGTIAAASQNGHGAQMDIVADLLEVVAAGSAASSNNGAVLLDAGALSAIGVDSLLLGGVRGRISDATTIDVKSSSVTVRNGAAIAVPDLIIAARDRIGVESGAQISTSGNSSQTYTRLQTGANAGSGNGALLRLSSGAQVDVKRDGTVTDSSGTLDIAAGARIGTARSALFDATGDMRLDGELALGDGAALNISANRISVGDAIGNVAGVKLSGEKLAALNASTLRLSSRSAIDFYGDVHFANERAELNAGALRAMTAGTVSIDAAGTLQLSNANNIASATGNASGASLRLSAKTIELGSALDSNTGMDLLGFSSVQVGAIGTTAAIIGQGTFKLNSDGALNVYADSIYGTAAANTTLTANGAVNIGAANAPPSNTSAESLGSSLTVAGSRISLDTAIVMPSGKVTLTATGPQADDNVSLGAGAAIDVSGRTTHFTYNDVRSDGGEVHLQAAAGNVEAAPGSRIAIGGSDGGNGGLLDIVASAGRVLWAGNVAGAGGNGAAGYNGGSLKLDASSIADAGAWLSRAAAAGIDKLISLRARSGDIDLDQNARAQTIAVAADGGALNVSGVLDASGSDGGSIALDAGGNVNIGSSALLRAVADGVDGRGGSVRLGTATGAINFDSGSRIDVSGNGGRDGSVLLRAPRNGANSDVALTNRGVAVTGAERIDLEAFNVYNSSVLTNSLLAGWQADSNVFMANEGAIKGRLGTLGSASNFHLRPGIEVDSAGDINVDEEINFVALRSGVNAEPGTLTLRAAGNVNVRQSLLDGFQTDTSSLSMLLPPFAVLLPGAAWDYRIVAGADIASANVDGVRNGTGNVVVGNGADLITGAGSIDIHAGNDVSVEQASSLIASLGSTRLRAYDNPLADLYGLPSSELLPDTGDFNAYWLFLVGLRYPQYPEQGGNVTITAGNDAKFAKTNYFFTDWLARIGGQIRINTAGEDIAPTYDLTTWGVLLDDLANQQGIAVMGGGNLAVSAGNDIKNLYAVLPVTARQDGNGTNHFAYIGGGNADIVAGNDILSPRIEVDKGHLNLSAGRNIGSSPNDLNAVFAIADTQVNLRAGGDILIDSIANSTVLPLAAAQNNGGLLPENYFFTYSDNAKLDAQSLGGNITLTSRVDQVAAAFNSRFATSLATTQGQQIAKLFATYPGSITLAAVQGDVRFQNQTLLFPAASGNLVVNAGNNIGGVGDITATVLVSDVGAESLPWYDRVFDLDALSPLVENAFANMLHGATPVHWLDGTRAIIDALSGDIAPQFSSNANNPQLQFTINKALLAHAGRDITNTNFYIQNNRDSDVSQLMAGRDLGFPLTIKEDGTIDQQTRFIRVAGPGSFNAIAGRNIDLGAATGIESIGNAENAALTDAGADVSLLAGINGRSALTDPILYNAFADRYLSASDTLTSSYIDWFAQGSFSGDIATLVGVFTGSEYPGKSAAIAAFNALPVLTRQAISLQAWQIQQADSRSHAADLIDFVSFERFDGDLAAAMNAVLNPAQPYSSNASAAAALALLPAAQQQQIALRAFNSSGAIDRQALLLSVLFGEVRNGGIESAKGLVVDADRDGFARSRKAIALMFPGNAWKGDINLVLSAVRTFGDGDINLLAPGGDVNVGLANNIGGITKESSALGLIAQRYGSINVMTDGDVNINQSRVFSLDGGDITMWSSNGNIDAGRGAKSALSIPPPVVKFDRITGLFKLEFPAAVSGSGIQTAANTRKTFNARGALLDDSIVGSRSDTRVSRQRYFDSLGAGDVYLFAPEGVINAGDAGISVGGNLLLAAQQVLGANNISVGGIAIGVPTTTAVSAGTLSLGDVASSATESATNSMNDAIREAAAALAESSAAFVTVDIIGVGN